MPRKKKKKARKPLRYKTITLKITVQQKKSLINFSKSRRTTPNKVIKKAIRPFLQNYADLEFNPKPEKVNQLKLFTMD
ncbi:MAG: hypothetical protein WCO93_00885 [bacterium]